MEEDPEFIIEGKAKDFTDMLKYASFGGLIGEIGIQTHAGNLGIVSSDDAKSGGKFIHIGKYNGFKVTGEDGGFGMLAKDNLDAVSKLYKSDDDIVMKVYKGVIIIYGPNDNIKSPRLTLGDLGTYYEKPPCEMTEDFIVLYNKGKVKPTTTVKMKANILSDIIKKANFVNQSYFPMMFTPEGLLKYSVGDNIGERASIAISSTIEGLDIVGTQLNVTLQAGFPEVAGIISGDIVLTGATDYPVWIKMEKANSVVGFWLSPRIEPETEDSE